MTGKTLMELTHPNDLLRNWQKYSLFIQGRTASYETDKRLLRKDGTNVWVHMTATLVRDAADRPLRVVAMILDITERTRSAALLDGQKSIFELLATGRDLYDVIAALIRIMEEQSAGLLSSVLIRRRGENHFYMCVAPSLPAAYREALQNAPIPPPYIGPCGIAVDQGVEVVVTDIATDERSSQEWRDLALSFGLRTCYSVPIFGGDGKVLGSFGMHYREVADPKPLEPFIVATATHLAGIVIERKQAEETLNASDAHRRY